ncbi:MAG TPA: copper resistance system multicopper oxidase [Steroidobacteraceae bacterium]|nr:copper resistance system multicopper oxidase [Steroidobacteraceae bacterium]
MDKTYFEPNPLGRGRRRFVCGLSGLLAAAALPLRVTAEGRLPEKPGTERPGSDFSLEVTPREVNFTGARRTATTVNGQVPGPLLRWREGDTVTVRLRNRLTVPTSIHWHGVIVPSDMDGVPGLSFPGVPPGETFEYRFRVEQSGTYWYHSHSRFQEQVGLYGPIVIEPRGGERHPADREHVVLLSDWTDMDPERLYRRLKLQSDYFNYGRQTAGDFFDSVRREGLKQALQERRMWEEMRMDPTDLADVSGHTYTYLMNGVTPAANWTGLFRPGERVRLRLINGSSMSYFDVRVPGLQLDVVAADGQDVEPVRVDELRIAAGEVYDVIVEPREERAYTIFAQSIDRSGYARGTLAPRSGMEAEVPAMERRALLTMADMGMGHDASMGPMVDSTAPDPREDLDDPGVGLRDNGRRVLTYGDLRTLGGALDSREPGRDIVLHLTGHMARFVWSFDGQKLSESVPLKFNYGERLRLVLINDSMMNHPIHLHGMWGEVEGPDGAVRFRKHTINVQPAQKLSYRVTANAIGRWAYHCHLLYHMEAGMFREVHVDPPEHP